MGNIKSYGLPASIQEIRGDHITDARAPSGLGGLGRRVHRTSADAVKRGAVAGANRVSRPRAGAAELPTGARKPRPSRRHPPKRTHQH
eukprot:9320726-Pyramimonas_sp.AAC.1